MAESRMTRDQIVATLRSIGPTIGSEAVALIEQIESQRDELLAALKYTRLIVSPRLIGREECDKLDVTIARSRK